MKLSPRILSLALMLSLCAQSFSIDAFAAPSVEPDGVITRFADPIDALSIGFASQQAMATVHFLVDGHWSGPRQIVVNTEQDPRSRESDLVIAPGSATAIAVLSSDPSPVIHPIRVSHDPTRYLIASNGASATPAIIGRRAWGADDDLLYVDAAHQETTHVDDVVAPTSGVEKTQRESDCDAAQRAYPEEFMTTLRKVIAGENGKKLRWPRTFSPQIRMITIHHTAVAATGDRRSAAEKMRALYQYHSVNRGWGDIGYHYVIGDDGSIFEGKSGGASVIGGHAYCHNTGTIGVALMGNFEVEEPSLAQVQSLQWLLQHLSEEYGMALDRNVTEHGITHPPVVGHRDLLATECPGYSLSGALDQIRLHVRTGDITAAVIFPPPRSVAPLPSAPAIPEESSDDDGSPMTRRLSTLQRKIKASIRLSSRFGGTAAKLETKRRTARREAAKLPAATRISRRTVASTLRPAAAAQERAPASQRAIRVRLSSRDRSLATCTDAPLRQLQQEYRGSVDCRIVDGRPALINTLSMEEYMAGLAEEPDTEPYEKQRAFAIAARSYALYYITSGTTKFPGKPYDASDDPAVFQKYVGRAFEAGNPQWARAVASTRDQVLTVGGQVLRAPYFSSDAGRTRSPAEAGWNNFPFADIFSGKEDAWCIGLPLAGHGVGMSGCGAKGQAHEGKTAEDILRYYYPGTAIAAIVR